jgi:Ca2+-binding EF-hand superfamily protein
MYGYNIHNYLFVFIEFVALFEEISERIDINRRAKEKFQELDTNNSGHLEAEELVLVAEWVLKTYGTSDDLEKTKQVILERIDENKDGVLSLQEFISLVEEVNARVIAMKKAMEKFHELDENGNGVLDRDEILHVVEYVLKTFYPDGAPLSAEEKAIFQNEMMQQVDVNNDGKLTLYEFSILFDKQYEQKSQKDRANTK